MKKETSLSIVSSQICICIGDIVYLPYILYIYVNKCITSLYCSVFMMAEHCCQACYGGSSLIWIILFRLMTGTANWSTRPRKKIYYFHNKEDFLIRLSPTILTSKRRTVFVTKGDCSLHNKVHTSNRRLFEKKKHFLGVTRVTKTPSARQQCWPESFCKSGKFLRQVHYWLKNIRILCNTKYPDNMQSVRMNWKVSGQSKKCLDNLENVSG